MKFNEDLASIHGYLCADGYVIRNPPSQKHKYYHIGFRNTNYVLLKDFQEKFERVFKLKPHITNEGRCRIQNKKLYYFLTKNQSFYSWHWQLPKLTKKQLVCWLRSYFDSDGWVFVKGRQNRHIGLDSVNKKGIIQISRALSSFGINTLLKKHRGLSRIFIYGKENLVLFRKQIDFLHPAKRNKLDEAIASYVS
jgi:intein/homing endonuclease